MASGLRTKAEALALAGCDFLVVVRAALARWQAWWRCARLLVLALLLLLLLLLPRMGAVVRRPLPGGGMC